MSRCVFLFSSKLTEPVTSHSLSTEAAPFNTNIHQMSSWREEGKVCSSCQTLLWSCLCDVSGRIWGTVLKLTWACPVLFLPSLKCAFPWLIWNKFCSSGPANIPWTAWSCSTLRMSLGSSPALTLWSFSGLLSLCLHVFSLHHQYPASLWSQFPSYTLLWLS